jgi:hypothetical protein
MTRKKITPKQYAEHTAGTRIRGVSLQY